MTNHLRASFLGFVFWALFQGAPSNASGQNGYEWDHADGVGIRFLMYNKMKRFEGSHDGKNPHVKFRYIPQGKDEIIRVNGHPYDWGLIVYEFDKEDAESSKALARSFDEFVRQADPTKNGRTIKIEGKPSAKSANPHTYWEYYDLMSKRLIPRKKAGSGTVYEFLPELGLRLRFPRTCSSSTSRKRLTVPWRCLRCMRETTFVFGSPQDQSLFPGTS